jgi:hypothetical protein
MKHLIFFTLCIFYLSGHALPADESLATSLKINIRNELGNMESGVLVTLYANQEDFKKEENPVQSGVTNEKGMVTFKKLDAKAYYVTAVKGDKNNFGLGVQTNTLEANKINKVTIIIE